VAAGGALGAPARYGAARLVAAFAAGGAGGFPWPTFTVNASGCLVVGLVAALLLAGRRDRTYLRAFLVTGFLGAYTTYSTFAVEADLLARRGHLGVAVAYAVASVAVGLAAVVAGEWLVTAAARRR
jgi:CrcB protein